MMESPSLAVLIVIFLGISYLLVAVLILCRERIAKHYRYLGELMKRLREAVKHPKKT